MSVRARLFLLVGLLSLMSLVIGIAGLKGMSDTVNGLQTVYQDRVVPLRDLKVIADMYAVNIVDTSHKVRNGNISWAEARKNLDDAETTIASKWKAYKATFLVEQEKKLVAEIEPMLLTVQKELDKMREILKREDAQAIAEFTKGPLYPAIDPISTKFSDLIEVQLNVAKDEYENSRDTYDIAHAVSVALLTLGIVGGAVLAFLIVRSVVNPLQQMQQVVSDVARSFDYSRRVKVRQGDEVGKTAHALNILLESQQRAIEEVNQVVTHLAQGGLDRRVTSDLQGDLRVMKDAINASLDSVQTTMDNFNGLTAALQQGQFSHRVHAEGIQGEFRKGIDQATAAMRSLEGMIGNVGAVMGAVAQGDLSNRITAQGQGDLELLKRNINDSLHALVNAMGVIHANTRQVATAANETSNAIGQISDGAQNQTHAISQVATAVRQTAESVSDVQKN